MNFLVETKNEYTIQLINILTPHIYDGFESIYTESKKIIKKGEEKKLLKAFQQFIRRIPQWNETLIENETNRVKTTSRCDFLENLLKAVIKANIVLLSNSQQTVSNNIAKKFLDIPLKKFLHRCYIECARQFYNSPYLFYHEIKPIDKKRNQRDCYDIIKSSIKEAIRKILPVQDILNSYLGTNVDNCMVEVDKPISMIDSENLRQLVNKDLNENSNVVETSDNNSNIQNNVSRVIDNSKIIESNNISKIEGNNEYSINKKSFTENIQINTLNMENLNVDNSNSGLQNNLIDSIENSKVKEVFSEKKNKTNEVSYQEILDSKESSDDELETLKLLSEIKKNILDSNDSCKVNNNENSINSEVRNQPNSNNEIYTANISYHSDVKKSEVNKCIDSESEIVYNHDDNDYEDVFSNIVESDSLTQDSVKNILNSENNKIKNKNMYFSNFKSL